MTEPYYSKEIFWTRYKPPGRFFRNMVFDLAAWLHDCGNITVPEHIVDEGPRLEANYNRIHEIRTRFEVLWRDAEIEYYQ